MDLKPEEHIVIDKNRMQGHALDFNFLRMEGIRLIQHFSGAKWSDFNLHDPGVTILEYLCYAITDIAYRTTFPINDILADRDGNVNRKNNLFFPREEVLSSGPVTVNDYRKFLIDQVSEIDNVWIEPIITPFTPLYSKGLYRVVIKPGTAVIRDLYNADETAGDQIIQQLIHRVKETLMDNRNIGDFYEEFEVLRPQPVYIRAEIVIKKNAIAEVVLAEIYEAMEQVLNPAVNFHTAAQLLAEGYAIEDIYTGPLLENGIIPDKELRDRTDELDPFILLKAISTLDGIVSIKNLSISADGEHFHKNVMRFRKQHFAFMFMENTYPQITLYHDKYPLYIQKQDVLKKEQGIKNRMAGSATLKRKETELKGEYRHIREYISLQTLFPAIYNINAKGATSGLSTVEIAKSRQLKAYLMLFEQVLANSLSQLANIGDLFSATVDNAKASTYYGQPLYNVPDARFIFKAFTENYDPKRNADWSNFKNDADNSFAKAMRKSIETDMLYKDRKKRALDHMLSRFNISLHKHPVFLYEHYYDRENADKRVDLEIKWKSDIIHDLKVFTSNRVKADNYHTVKDDESLENGFGRKMSLLLHIRNNSRNKMSKVIERYGKELALTDDIDEGRKPQKTETFNWRNEDLQILSDLGEHEIESGQHDEINHNVTFKQQSELLFQSAVSSENYKMIPYPIGAPTVTAALFKHPNDTKWSIVSKHAEEYEAVKAVKKTISFFKEISIASEGFYMLEHILLKQPLAAEVHGFNFVVRCHDLIPSGKENLPLKILIRQKEWQSFQKREQTIKTLLQIASEAGTTEDNYKSVLSRLSKLCTFSTGNMEPDENTVIDLLYNLKQFDMNNTDFYPEFNYTVKLANDQEIAEDFFNFRMTVIFPTWPARFQDKSFREMAKGMFREECPAHIKLSFLWLSLPEMTTFDELYFDWLDALKTNAPDTGNNSQLADQLTQLLIASGIKYNNSIIDGEQKE